MKKAVGLIAWLKKVFPAIRDIRLQKIVLAAVIFAVLYLLLAFAGMPARVNLELGRPSTETIYAPRDIIDEYTTEQLREAAAEAVPEVYDYNPDILADTLAVINDFFETAQRMIKDEELTEEEKIDVLEDMLDEEVPRSAVAVLLSDSATMRELQERLTAAVTAVFERGIMANGVESAKRELNQEIALFPFNADLKRVAERLVVNRVKANMLYNPETTALNREAARQAIEPVLILRNTLIISEGELVTEKQMAQLESLGLIRGQHADYPAFIGLFLLLLILLWFRAYICQYLLRMCMKACPC